MALPPGPGGGRGSNNRPDIGLRVQIDGLDALVAAFKREEDCKQLRKELAKNMREALTPAAAEARSGIMAMSSTMSTSPALRPAIAKKIRPEVKLGGRWSGARVKAKKTPGLREFANAPKRTQRSAGWRHRVFGRDVWVVQHGKIKWFDEALSGRAAHYREAVMEAMEDMARRLASRSGGSGE
ncbi:hypothetical protein [Candidatus Frankia alpina]|uniref:hypothetical protein n=1 Tax=Candidatus Frankia alpina TaxID=2699483 RepID=UPI001967B414|nr:hypothetical protein [Candidatus Frankia alpina]